MDSSRRAVESFWRSRMIDAATSDEDKVTPVYKLEEICELLRSSQVSIVKEISEFLLKRLEHKSPIVKQKALRLIKYAVGKSGADFRREMQRHSVAVKQLFHYQGQLDPLKADALNKAVRDTALEASAAIFAGEENKAAPSENLNKRIQGFGNTNFEMQSEDKKSFLSEVVDIGSASIKQGLHSFKQAHSMMKSDTGSYKSPNLRRSLTNEMGYKDKYEPAVIQNEKLRSLELLKNGSSGPWGQDSRFTTIGTTNNESTSSYSEGKSREEKLLDTIVTSGGVRLQPTRDAIHIFLVEAAKLDAVPLSLSLESKLQSTSWQVRMKAICVLEAILRRKDDGPFFIVATYFSENKNVIQRCSESPQASLSEKADRVLSLLEGGESGSSEIHLGNSVKYETAAPVELPNLIDTDDSNNFYGEENSIKSQSDNIIENLASATPLIDDIFGNSIASVVSTSEQKVDDDPFADVSFHNSDGKEHVDDLFGGITVDKNGGIAPDQFDIFGFSTALPPIEDHNAKDINDIMVGLSINGNSSQVKKPMVGLSINGNSSQVKKPSEIKINLDQKHDNGGINDIIGQTVGENVNSALPIGSMLYNMPPGNIFNQGFPSQPANYGAMGNLLAQQQQFLATMANFQLLGNMSSQNQSAGLTSGTMEGGYSSPLPDVFPSEHPNSIPQGNDERLQDSGYKSL